MDEKLLRVLFYLQSSEPGLWHGSCPRRPHPSSSSDKGCLLNRKMGQSFSQSFLLFQDKVRTSPKSQWVPHRGHLSVAGDTSSLVNVQEAPPRSPILGRWGSRATHCPLGATLSGVTTLEQSFPVQSGPLDVQGKDALLGEGGSSQHQLLAASFERSRIQIPNYALLGKAGVSSLHQFTTTWIPSWKATEF